MSELREILADAFDEDVAAVIEQMGEGPVTISPTLLSHISDLEHQDVEMLSSLNTLESEAASCCFVLIGCERVVENLAPIKINDADDWLRELANLVAGRIQNSLFHYNIVCKLGLPASIRHHEWVTNDFDWHIVSLSTQFGEVFACLQYEISPSWQWTEVPTDIASSPGSVILF